MISPISTLSTSASVGYCSLLSDTSGGVCVQTKGRLHQDWEKCKELASQEKAWISSLLTDTTIIFLMDGVETQWRIGHRLDKEKELPSDHPHDTSYGVSAVFDCFSSIDKSDRASAVCKVYLEVPGEADGTSNSKIRSWVLNTVAHEIETLQRLTAMGAGNPGPRILSYRCFAQTTDMWLTGGYLCMILMQKLPGISLSYETFYSFPLAKRDEIRAAFSETERNLITAGIWHWDTALRNLIWDDEQKKCYIIDYGDIDFLGEEEIEEMSRKDNWESAWSSWGLRRPLTRESNGL